MKEGAQASEVSPKEIMGFPNEVEKPHFLVAFFRYRTYNCGAAQCLIDQLVPS